MNPEFCFLTFFVTVMKSEYPTEVVNDIVDQWVKESENPHDGMGRLKTHMRDSRQIFQNGRVKSFSQ